MRLSFNFKLFKLIINNIPLILFLYAIYNYNIYIIDFYFSFYMHVVDYLDFLVLITYPLNFLVYCLMSKLFRRQFILMFNFIKYKPYNNLDIHI